jgi:hypothetical protein
LETSASADRHQEQRTFSDVDRGNGFAVSTLPYRGLMACSLTHCEQVRNIARKTIQKVFEPRHFADPEAKDSRAECSL